MKSHHNIGTDDSKRAKGLCVGQSHLAVPPSMSKRSCLKKPSVGTAIEQQRRSILQIGCKDFHPL
jgi:hypothetical protein